MAEIYQSIRKMDTIFFDGHSHLFDKLSGKDLALTAAKLRIHMKAGDVVQERGEHLSHAPNLPKIEAAN